MENTRREREMFFILMGLEFWSQSHTLIDTLSLMEGVTPNCHFQSTLVVLLVIDFHIEGGR